MFNHDTRTRRALIDFFIFESNIIHSYKYLNCRDTYKFITDTFLPRLLRIPAVYKQKIQLYESNYLDTLIKCKIFTKYNT